MTLHTSRLQPLNGSDRDNGESATDQVHAYILKGDKELWEDYLLSKKCLKAEKKDSNLALVYAEPAILVQPSTIKGFSVAPVPILLSDLISFGGLTEEQGKFLLDKWLDGEFK